ncbi:aldo/keto reductase [Luteimonas sp. SX5]|uniref:Aldo/keto reductase n=1 Tax=Luteimonas galliterrae TaxID=2940486 RepID=A0ABT0MH86_9GAMM|nr:aldo/keto reductase [Luteimonas galliterrae]MCL1634235.1 aldo/keto reductase [Luteimonas galliterrae]
MITRRDFIAGAASAAAVALMPFDSHGQSAGSTGRPPSGTLIKRAIPSTGERIPVMGIGSSGTFGVFEAGAPPPDRVALREVFRLFVDAGCTVVDTAPLYGDGEIILGDLIADFGVRDKLFLATKLTRVTGRDEGLAQFQASLRRLKTDKVELLQVHDMRDLDTQFALTRELKQRGLVKYVGLTHSNSEAQDRMADAMQKLKPDFVQINYSPVSRGAERRIFPLAKDLGIAVIANRTFEDGKLFGQVKGKPLPDWAKEVDADSWAQLFLKFVISEPAVTAVIPATSKPKNQADNLKAGFGRLMSAEQRAALVAAIG